MGILIRKKCSCGASIEVSDFNWTTEAYWERFELEHKDCPKKTDRKKMWLLVNNLIDWLEGEDMEGE